MLPEAKRYVLIDEDGSAVSELVMTEEQFEYAQAQLSSSCDGQIYWEESNENEGHRWVDNNRIGE